MRHRASRSLFDVWRRVLPGLVTEQGPQGRSRPVRALAAFVLVAGIGTGAFVTVASLGSSSDGAGSALQRQPPRATTSPDDARSGAASAPSAAGSSQAARPQADSPAAGSTPSVSVQAPDPSRLRDTTSSVPSVTSSPLDAGSTEKPVDRTPPNTSLSQEFPDGDTAVFSFSSNESASFRCSLDGAASTLCDSPTSYSRLDPGWHTFAVTATDDAGNVDPTPARARWHANGGPTADH